MTTRLAGRSASLIHFYKTRLGDISVVRCISSGPGSSSGQMKDSSSFAMNIFRGQVQSAELFPYPTVLNDEQKERLQTIEANVDKFVKENFDPLVCDATEHLDKTTMKGLRDLGAFGLQIPTELGGQQLGHSQYGKLMEVLAKHCLGLTATVGFHQSTGLKGILLFGSKAQKAKYLPRLASGEDLACFCVTEPNSGSDASSIKCRAIPTADGHHFILNGSKIWISNGGVANIFTVFAKTPLTDPYSDVEAKDRVTAFIVEKGFEGVSCGPPEKKMGIKACNTTSVHFEDVKIPKENMLGELGEGFKVAMSVLNIGRCGLSTLMTGAMQHCIEQAVEHAAKRKQFGKEIIHFEAIQEKIAKMVMKHYVAESMAFMIAGNMDSGSTAYHMEAAIGKIFASEAAWYCVDEAIQITGGKGFMTDSGLEKVMRDLRLFRIIEGSNEILRLFIALTGIQYSGGSLKGALSQFKNPAANLGLMVNKGSKKVLKVVGVRTSPSFAQDIHPRLKSTADDVSHIIDTFGETIEHLLDKHGTKIIDEQFLLTRVANAAIDIYAIAVCLSRCTKSLEIDIGTAEMELAMTKTFWSEAKQRISQSLEEVDSDRWQRNFENMTAIVKTVAEAKGPFYKHPLEL